LRRCNLIIAAMIFLFVGTCQDKAGMGWGAQSSGQQTAPKGVVITDNQELDYSKFKVTFLEIGSTYCMQCRAMQPIVEEIAAQFAGKVQVVSYDFRKDPTPARERGVRFIPTQIFLDHEGKEFFRHTGYLPKEEILKILEKKDAK
jgi:thiol-disulfide isomerase/thioredoxin